MDFYFRNFKTRSAFIIFSSLILLSFVVSAQSSKSKLTNDQWLKMITGNAIGKSDKPNTFLKPHPGYALYFAKAGSIDQPYLVYVPMAYDATRPHSVVVFLHGAILAKEEFQYKNVDNTDEPIFSLADAFNTIIIFPFARQDFKWLGQSPAFENIISIIKQVEQNYNVDKKKVYIGGISMGGNATYWYINNHPDMFAGFYTVSALPGAGGFDVKFSNITSQKPLYSINAKDDPVFEYSDVAAAHEKHKNETTGWHFSTVESGGHRFIYGNGGEKYLKTLVGDLFQNRK